MKTMDWMIALSLVLVGLTCLTMSATWMLYTDTTRSYLTTLLKYFLWAGVPVLVASLIYLFFIRNRKDSIRK